MKRLVEGEVNHLQEKACGRYREKLDSYGLMLPQIRYWMKTGFHRSGKIVSVWEKQARTITRSQGGGVWTAMDRDAIGERVCDRSPV